MRLSHLFLALFLVPALTQARLGESMTEFGVRYGLPKDTLATQIADKNQPLLEGAIHHNYEFHGWKIRAAFLEINGPCVRIRYQKVVTTGVNPVVQDYELQAIEAANTPPGMSWKKVMYNNPNSPNKGLTKLAEAYFLGAMGESMWQRTDGAVLGVHGRMIVELELPAAREHEAQLKAAKEQKARMSVPSF